MRIFQYPVAEKVLIMQVLVSQFSLKWEILVFGMSDILHTSDRNMDGIILSS